MNTQLTEIAFILDRSGSMASMTEPAIAGFNDFLRTQQASLGDARLTTILFDDAYQIHTSHQPIAEVQPLDTTTFIPRGSTALLDAIGRTVDALGQRLAEMPAPDRPGKMIVAILTDGLENASQRFTWQDITTRIRHQTEQYAWEFLFLGANQDAIATASKMGIQAANAATYAHSPFGIASSGRAMSRKIAAMRAEKFQSADEFAASPFAVDASADLSELYKQESESVTSSNP